ncbi:MAG: isochorismatase family protein [Clostridiales bacterium]|nr:isochorismatase family protein [Clostridiales bacterium]
MLIPGEERLKRGRAAVIECADAECDICYKACGFYAIGKGEDGLPYSNPQKCVGCGGCAAVCPKRAIKLLKDRGDGTYEVTLPWEAELPEIDDTVLITPPGAKEPVRARVLQARPKNPRVFSALVTTAVPKYGEALCSEPEPLPKDFLVVVDMQNDFVSGSLGTKEAESIVPAAVKKIEGFKGGVFATLDTHFEDYLDTREGRLLPVPHCISGTRGHELEPLIREALEKKSYTPVEKLTFGSVNLPNLVQNAANGAPDSVEFIGLCTDICVVSNALIMKARFPEASISVDASCCAGVTPELHEAALKVMQSCQITVKR